MLACAHINSGTQVSFFIGNPTNHIWCGCISGVICLIQIHTSNATLIIIGYKRDTAPTEVLPLIYSQILHYFNQIFGNNLTLS